MVFNVTQLGNYKGDNVVENYNNSLKVLEPVLVNANMALVNESIMPILVLTDFYSKDDSGKDLLYNKVIIQSNKNVDGLTFELKEK